MNCFGKSGVTREVNQRELYLKEDTIHKALNVIMFKIREGDEKC